MYWDGAQLSESRSNGMGVMNKEVEDRITKFDAIYADDISKCVSVIRILINIFIVPQGPVDNNLTLIG